MAALSIGHHMYIYHGRVTTQTLGVGDGEGGTETYVVYFLSVLKSVVLTVEG